MQYEDYDDGNLEHIPYDGVAQHTYGGGGGGERGGGFQ